MVRSFKTTTSVAPKTTSVDSKLPPSTIAGPDNVKSLSMKTPPTQVPSTLIVDPDGASKIACCNSPGTPVQWSTMAPGTGGPAAATPANPRDPTIRLTTA